MATLDRMIPPRKFNSALPRASMPGGFQHVASFLAVASFPFFHLVHPFWEVLGLA